MIARLLPAVALSLVLSACATTPPLMTDVERREKATIAVSVDLKSAVSHVTTFLLADGYTIDRYDEMTETLSTGWAAQKQNALAKSITGEMTQRVQARFTPNGESINVEFWMFSRFGGEREEINLYPARYDDLMTRLRAYLLERSAL